MKASKKVEGGKLVRAEVESVKIIKSVKITGDFFLHPENTLDLIEQNLLGTPLEPELIESKIKQTLQENNATLYGVTAKDLADVITEAIK